ncbi:hypothetical protein B0J12DRAFT_786360 [Macrophomina phaseolina]|uniref:Histidine phosphatase superfamily clade-1 n=1 Tax=Macrophomina phaseolina TaxID=35725 RepID=A0ABQ8G9W3_9PEZI|nr:hypothetical protein B0J12DRAFT_786360 [Macrophomina phaseolina]
MASPIDVVRHTESNHIVSKDFCQLDPSVTQLGLRQAAQLIQTFPDPSSIAIILTSTLKRAIQTTLAGFPYVEMSALPCGTRSDRDVLEKAFPRLYFGGLAEAWQWKEGLYSAGNVAVEERPTRVRRGLAELSEQLKDNERNGIVVVKHGGFVKFLSEDREIDLSKAVWKSYTVAKDNGGEFMLIPVETTIDAKP